MYAGQKYQDGTQSHLGRGVFPSTLEVVQGVQSLRQCPNQARSPKIRKLGYQLFPGSIYGVARAGCTGSIFGMDQEFIWLQVWRDSSLRLGQVHQPTRCPQGPEDDGPFQTDHVQVPGKFLEGVLKIRIYIDVFHVF